MTLPQPTFQAQAKGEGETSAGTFFVLPTYLSRCLLPSLPITKPWARCGVPLWALRQYFPPPPVFPARAGLRGARTMEAAPALARDPFGFQNPP